MTNLSTGWLEMTVTFSVFAGMYLLNIIFGVIENCIVNGTQFDGRKILMSLSRILMAGIFSAALLFGFNALSLIPESFGMNVSEAAASVISIGTFILMYTKGFFYLAVNVYEKIRAWFEVKSADGAGTGGVSAGSYLTEDGGAFEKRPSGDVNADTVNHEIADVPGVG